MPPRVTPQAPRGRGGPRVGTTRPAIAPAPRAGGPVTAADHVVTTGVKRKGFGTAGKEVKISTNHFELKVDCDIVYQYDGKSTIAQTNTPCLFRPK